MFKIIHDTVANLFTHLPVTDRHAVEKGPKNGKHRFKRAIYVVVVEEYESGPIIIAKIRNIDGFRFNVNGKNHETGLSRLAGSVAIRVYCP
ncbi:MAG: hypothetical protein PVF82_16325 [Gammaproteobacteria bacterium]|jgi:hypothetical protein